MRPQDICRSVCDPKPSDAVSAGGRAKTVLAITCANRETGPVNQHCRAAVCPAARSNQRQRPRPRSGRLTLLKRPLLVAPTFRRPLRLQTCIALAFASGNELCSVLKHVLWIVVGVVLVIAAHSKRDPAVSRRLQGAPPSGPKVPRPIRRAAVVRGVIESSAFVREQRQPRFADQGSGVSLALTLKHFCLEMLLLRIVA